MDAAALTGLGLSEGEAKAYSALLRLGPSSAGHIITASGVARSKIYIVLEKLVKKGLVSFILKGGVRHYQATDPARLHDYLDEKEEAIARQREQVDLLVPLFRTQLENAESPTQAQLYQGLKGVRAVHERTYDKLARDEEYFYLGIPPLDAFQEKHDWYWQRDHRRRIEAGIRCRLLFNQGTDRQLLVQRNKFKGCEARYMPIPVTTPACILGYKDTTAIGFLGEGSVIVEIVNAKIASSFKNYFEWFWSQSEKFS